MYELSIKNLEIYAFHGVPQEERTIGHRYQISLTMLVEGTADRSDLVTETVDYGSVALAAQNFAMTNIYSTVEKLAHELGGEILRQFEMISEIEVIIEKRLPPAPVIAESAGVRLRLRRLQRSVS